MVSGGRRTGRLAAIGALVIVAIVATLFATGVLGGSEPSQAERQKALADHLRLPVQTAFRYRDTLLLAEREFLGASRESNNTLRRYQRRLAQVKAANKRISDANQPLYDACANSAVACPNPTYEEFPNIPDLGDTVKQFRAAASRLDRLNADVLSVSPRPELKGFYAQLSSAAKALQDDATYNADTITKAVVPGEPAHDDSDGGYVDRAQIKTLRNESALPAIRQLNREALSVVRKLGLSVASYDIPGGTDRDPADHSTLR